jgi:hypothetical protein
MVAAFMLLKLCGPPNSSTAAMEAMFTTLASRLSFSAGRHAETLR